MPTPYADIGSGASDSAGSAASSRSGHTSPDGGDFASSSIYSHARSTASFSPINSFGLFNETLSDEEIAQIESFYKGLFSSVYVCPTVAALYLFAEGPKQSIQTARNSCRLPPNDGGIAQTASQNRSNNQPSGARCNQGASSAQKTGWTLEFSEGVPVVVHVTRPGKRSVHFIFAERGTGFPLWRDSSLVPDSRYTCIDSDYHEFRAGDLRVGLRFSAASAASKFLQQVVALVSNPATFVEPKAGRRSSNATTPPKEKLRRPKKSTISPPCCFSHRTHIAKEDALTSLSEFVNESKQTVLHDNRANMAVSSKIYGTCRS